MFSKKTEPIISGGKVVGTRVEYRMCGILLYQKTLYNPEKYGIEEYNLYQTSI